MANQEFCPDCPLRSRNRNKEALDNGEIKITVTDDKVGTITAAIHKGVGCGLSYEDITDTRLAEELKLHAKNCESPSPVRNATRQGLLGFIGVGLKPGLDCQALNEMHNFDPTSPTSIEDRLALAERGQ